jgi:hypothetical protein
VPPPGARSAALRWDWLIFAPVVLEDTKPESGRLSLPGIITFNTPLPQTGSFSG